MGRVPRLKALAIAVLALVAAGCAPHPQQHAARRVASRPRPESRSATDGLRRAAKGKGIVICILDAARADHVGCYGYPRDTTPNIDRIAQESFVFENHFAQFPETKPSTASLFTGEYPDTHLAYGPRTIEKDSFTLARGLKAAGYHTALFSANGYASPMWGLGTEFGETFYEPDLKKAGRDIPAIWKPEALLELLAPWLRKGPPEPFLLYLHFMPPHDPYLAPAETKFRYANQTPPGAWESAYPFAGVELEARKRQRPWSQAAFINAYDGNLRYADWAVGELERLLHEAGHDDTILIITSDHGEAFGEHGYRGHTFSAFDESIHIPMIMRMPGLDPPVPRIKGLTQTVDLLPTLMDLVGVSYPRDHVQGRSLLPLMSGEKSEVNDYVFARAAGQPPSYIVRDHDWLLLLYHGERRLRGARMRALYDLRKDPRALTSVFDESPEQAARLTDVFKAFARTQRVPPLDFVDPNAPPQKLPQVNEIKLTPEMRRSLKALGYLE
jgi:arylsulfatase A-like enzyme